jgi:pimeloyl-ACP methyl ester carboxylesterase
MAPLMRELQSDFRCIALDRPPYRHSYDFDRETTVEEQAEAIRSVHDAETTENVWLFGHSSGGNYALAYAMRHPERVCGVLLMEPALYAVYPADRIPVAVSRYHEEVLTAARRGDMETAVRVFTEILDFNDPATWSELQSVGLTDRFEDNLVPYGTEIAPALTWCPSMDEFASFALPTLLIEGATTTPVLRDIVALLDQAIPHTRVSTIAAGNHFSPQIHAAAVGEAIRSFIQGQAQEHDSRSC